MGQRPGRVFAVVAVALATDVAQEYIELARRRLSKVGVVFLEDDDAVNIQSAPRVSNELAPPHLVPARRCIEEIHKYSLCLQTSACPAPLAKATSRATTPRCEGAPTAAAVTQLVEERVRATGDDEATTYGAIRKNSGNKIPRVKLKKKTPTRRGKKYHSSVGDNLWRLGQEQRTTALMDGRRQQRPQLRHGDQLGPGGERRIKAGR